MQRTGDTTPTDACSADNPLLPYGLLPNGPPFDLLERARWTVRSYQKEWIPGRLGRESKARGALGHSTLEALWCYASEWQERVLAPGGRDQSDAPYPFSSESLMLARMYALLDVRRLPAAGVEHLACAWDMWQGEIGCAGVCWESSPSVAAFDSAFCYATGVPAEVVATAKAEVIAASRPISVMRGGEAEVMDRCHAPGNCPGPAA